MTDGAYEYVLVGFHDTRFRAELVPALIDLVGLGTIRVLDLVVITKSHEGAVAALEIDELEDEQRELFFDLDGEYDGLISEDDIAMAARAVSPGDTAVLLIWEDIWAERFAEAIREADGEVIASARVPTPVMERAMKDFVTA